MSKKGKMLDGISVRELKEYEGYTEEVLKTKIPTSDINNINLLRNDLLAYINTIKSYTVPTPEEEYELAVKSANGDIKAKDELLVRNLRLVLSIAFTKSKSKSYMDVPDLCQEGSIGLMSAVEKFEPERGFRFSTYATYWITQAMNRYLNQANPIRIPEHIFARLRKAYVWGNEFESKTGREPSSEELEGYLETIGLTMQEYSTYQNKLSVCSLDTRVSGEDDRDPLYNIIIDDDVNANPETAYMESESHDVICESLKILTKAEQEVICKRFGIYNDEFDVKPNDGIKTLAVVGKSMGITRERVRQLEARALSKLSHNFETRRQLELFRN